MQEIYPFVLPRSNGSLTVVTIPVGKLVIRRHSGFVHAAQPEIPPVFGIHFDARRGRGFHGAEQLESALCSQLINKRQKNPFYDSPRHLLGLK